MLRTAVIVAALTCPLTGCRPAAEATAARVIRIATAGSDSEPQGRDLILALLGTTGGELRAEAVATTSTAYSIHALHDRTADLVFSRADILYGAYSQGTLLNPEPHRKIRGIAVLYGTALHLVVRHDSGIRRLVELHGGRIARSGAPAGTPPVLQYNLLMDVLRAGGELNPDNLETVRMSNNDVATALADGTIQGGFILASYPVRPIEVLARQVPIRLLAIKPGPATRIRAKYPFYRPVVIPASTYAGQQEDVVTIGVDNLLVCRDDLDEDVVYRLTKSLFESLPRLARQHQVIMKMDRERAPATPIPLHPGAARYYRERELLR